MNAMAGRTENIRVAFTSCSKRIASVGSLVLMVLSLGANSLATPTGEASEKGAATSSGSDRPKHNRSAATKKSGASKNAKHAEPMQAEGTEGGAIAGKEEEPAAADAKLTEEVNNPAFKKILLQIAAKYPSFGRTDTGIHHSPFDCVMPRPPHAFASGSDDDATHGQKLYYLYAKNREEYLRKDTPTVGQAIVKESYHPLGGADPYALGEKYGLFIMTKLDAATPETDEGWVYGTVSGDGKKVLSAGRVMSCMNCHTGASNDRLFGLKGRVYMPTRSYSKW